jgi:hypothetical protein
VLPKALYGCELWSSLSLSNITQLERSHRFCLKFIQNLPLYTNNDIALAACGVSSIETVIDYRKLQFFGQLCRLPNRYVSKQMFVHRLIKYFQDDNQTIGFIPDIYRIIMKYNLFYILDSFIKSATFPSKYTWKSILKQNVTCHDTSQRIVRLGYKIKPSYVSFMFYKDKPCRLWQLSRSLPNMRKYCFTAMQIYSKLLSFSSMQKCDKCNYIVDNLTTHLFHFCPNNHLARKKLWSNIIKYCGDQTYRLFILNDPREQIFILLSGLCLYISDDIALELFFGKMLTLIHSLLGPTK